MIPKLLVLLMSLCLVIPRLVWAKDAQEYLIQRQEQLGSWLMSNINELEGGNASGRRWYPPGLIIKDPALLNLQERQKIWLLEYLKSSRHAAHKAQQSRSNLYKLILGQPVNGRLFIEKVEPRWLETNNKFNPVLMPGMSLVIPWRPSKVHVIRSDGQVCRVPHDSSFRVKEYISSCEPGAQATHARVIQPDGKIQEYGIASWNHTELGAVAPGAWVIYETDSNSWDRVFFIRLSNWLATQGVAIDGSENNIDVSEKLSNYIGKDYKPLRYTPGDWGGVGLIQTPSARMNPAGEFSLSITRTAPYKWINISMQPLDWLEGVLRYVDIESRPYGPAAFSGSQSDKDKSIDFKFKLTEETSWMPQISAGVRDVGGTGLFAGEYIVGNKRWYDLDFTMGLGWGYLGARGALENPLSIFGDRFKTRSKAGNAQGGDIPLTRLFTGPVSIFGGIEYQTPLDDLLVKVEYDGNDYRSDPGGGLNQRIPINFGLNYRYSPEVDFMMTYERGTVLGFGINMHGRIDKMSVSKIFDPEQLPVSMNYPTLEPDWKEVAAQLELTTKWRVNQVLASGQEILVIFDNAEAQTWNGYIDRISAVLHRYAPYTYKYFRIQALNKGLGVNEYAVDRVDWVQAKTEFVADRYRHGNIRDREHRNRFEGGPEKVLASNPFGTFTNRIGVTYNQTLGGPDSFLLYQVGWGASGTWNIKPNLWLSGAVQYRLFDNYDVYKLKSDSLLPNVRTRMREYSTTSKVTIPALQATYVAKVDKDHYYSLYGGMLESMFGGVGGEWLYRPWRSKVALGADLNYVWQRAYEQDLSFQAYKVLTGHVSIYANTGVEDIIASLKFGRYLAGDYGATFDLSREFSNGIRVGAFATLTNVSAAQFGEGSFDKGLYASVPFDTFLPRSSNSVANILWRPVTRDGGAILSKQSSLYDLTKNASGRSLRFGDAGSVDHLDCRTCNHERISAWSTYIDDIENIPSSLEVNKLSKIGGIVLASSILDKPADRASRKYGNNAIVNKLELLGDYVPVLAMGMSGMLSLGAQDPVLAKTSVAAFQAGLTSSGVVSVSKYVIGRDRPGVADSPYSFHSNTTSRDYSFPSLRTAVAWATITPYAVTYDMPLLYALPLMTNFSRVSGGRHWLSDTLASAFVGFGLGNFFLNRRMSSPYVPDLLLSPGQMRLAWHL